MIGVENEFATDVIPVSKLDGKNEQYDLLPVMIFVTAKAAIQNFPAYVKLIDDYVRLKGVF